ncbi:MAG: 3-methyl-2-oxobutanoate hydroxymethyltransferase [Verrucomicrobia bacterium]|nr:3-methyl-2-oxobutanoate hydroxymethyltransferase [Verrucomicrobiota bacterium]
MSKKWTIQGIFDAKGKQQLSEIYTESKDEARAAEEAGIDMIVTPIEHASKVRAGAPNTFLILGMGVNNPNVCNGTEAIRKGFEAIQAGADAVYCGMSVGVVAEMAKESIPVIGHVGYIPYRNSWFGGARAIGKKADEAMKMYERTRAYEDAGAIGVELEIVPEEVATEISKRVKFFVISMGSGTGCDAQYLFAEDILGTNTGHVPRHAKMYANIRSEMDRIQGMRTTAFKSFHDEVNNGKYPEAKHCLKIAPDELAEFRKRLNG